MSEDRIGVYARYFTDKLEKILAIEESHPQKFDQSSRLFKKILVIILIDTLSKIIYGKNRQRFTKILRNFTTWDSGELLSATHINRALELDTNPGLKQLRNQVSEKLVLWEAMMKEISLVHDLSKPEVISLLPHSAHNQLAGISIEKFNHYNLVYELRNALIHELREKGYGIEGPNNNEPYYHKMDKLTGTDEFVTSWELVYPLDFLASLARTALANLIEHLRQNNLNPDRHFRFGSYLIDKLNPEML